LPEIFLHNIDYLKRVPPFINYWRWPCKTICNNAFYMEFNLHQSCNSAFAKHLSKPIFHISIQL